MSLSSFAISKEVQGLESIVLPMVCNEWHCISSSSQSDQMKAGFAYQSWLCWGQKVSLGVSQLLPFSNLQRVLTGKADADLRAGFQILPWAQYRKNHYYHVSEAIKKPSRMCWRVWITFLISEFHPKFVVRLCKELRMGSTSTLVGGIYGCGLSLEYGICSCFLGFLRHSYSVSY